MALTEVGGHAFSEEFLRSFDVIEQIGSGFSGTVVLAEQLSLNRKVAIKLLDPHTSDGETLEKRFQREARILSELAHPNIINVYDYGIDGNVPYLVQEYLRGETLQERMERKRLTVRETVKLVSHIAAALAHSHKVSVLHRDVKPANIFLTDDGRTILLDYGLAISDDYCTILTRSGFTVGTPIYMAPEQMQCSVVNAAADIYSVGMVFFRLLANDFPFEVLDKDFYELKLTGDINSLAELFPTLPSELTNLVDDCLAREPMERPKDGKALLSALRKLPKEALKDEILEAVTLEELPSIPAEEKKAPTPPKKIAKASKLNTGRLAFALLTFLVLATLLLYQKPSLSPLPATVTREVTIKDLQPTEITLLVKANPSCRATIFAHVGEVEYLKKNVLAVPAGSEVNLCVPSATTFNLKALFARNPKPIVRKLKTMTPALTAIPLMDKMHLEKEKTIPRYLARAIATGKVALSCSPAIWNERVAVNTRKQGVFCWSIREKRILWHNKSVPKFYRMTASPDGVFGYTHDSQVFSLSATHGKILWRRELGGIMEGGPYVHGKHLFVRRKIKNGAIIALNTKTGEMTWQKLNESLSQPWSVTSGGLVFIPEIIIGTVHCFRAETGEVLPSPKAFKAGRLSTPVVGVGNILYAGLDTGLIVGGQLGGKRLMAVKVTGEPRHLIADNDRLYAICSTPHHVVGISIKEGRAIWQHDLRNPVYEHLFISDERLYVHETPRTLRNTLHILDSASGTLLGHFKNESFQSIRSVSIDDGLLLVASDCSLAQLRLHGARK